MNNWKLLRNGDRIDRKRTNFNVKFLCASERYRIRRITQFSEELMFLRTQECGVLAFVGLWVGSGKWSVEMSHGAALKSWRCHQRTTLKFSDSSRPHRSEWRFQSVSQVLERTQWTSSSSISFDQAESSSSLWGGCWVGKPEQSGEGAS